MKLKLSEKQFESDIEYFLINQSGYTKGNQSTYDKEFGLDMPTLLSFIESTQLKQYERFCKRHPVNTDTFLKELLHKEINKKGLLQVLRNGFSEKGISFKVVYFKPETTLNSSQNRKYKKNIFHVTRQFYYSTKNNKSLDIVLLINGIPIVSMELKNRLTNQNYNHAINQYRQDRDPKELVFQFNRRFLVHFALDSEEVWMTTQLKGHDTHFLPFNQGSNGAGNVGGKGNPHNPQGYTTSYFWENVLNTDTLLSIIQRFITINENNTLIFPRYHQLDVVQKLVADTKQSGSGKSYLIQHSAGSGKSNSIAWLGYFLSSLHSNMNTPLFDSVIIVTDRKQLDKQLQDTISAFEHQKGLVVTIDDKKSSQDLKNAITDNKKIIISTIQKFPYVYKELGDNQHKKFAIIIDEAHRSQTGSAAYSMKVGLSGSGEDVDDIERAISEQGKHDNLSMYAFTATPKKMTLEMFGSRNVEGNYFPFHVYSMRQAIEEGFILDVLKYYMTTKVYMKVKKTVDDNPEVDTSRAIKAIMRTTTNEPLVIKEKTQLMAHHFRTKTRKKIGGLAKAMLVASSRKQAVLYFKEFQKYSDIRALVAFSDSVYMMDKYGVETRYTEESLNVTKNGYVRSSEIPREFKENYDILIVAEKFQTGFDEPLLHTMFIDTGLKDVKAVQTLSRVNRTYNDGNHVKRDTFILDFVNDIERIRESFQPYYDSAILEAETDSEMLDKLLERIHMANLYTVEDVNYIIDFFIHTINSEEAVPGIMGLITSHFSLIRNKYSSLSKNDRYAYRTTVRKYIKWYDYIKQIAVISDKDKYKEYKFLIHLEPFLFADVNEEVDYQTLVKLDTFRIDEDFNGEITLSTDVQTDMLTSSKMNQPSKKDWETSTIDDIVTSFNTVYGEGLGSDEEAIVRHLYALISEDSINLKGFAQENEFPAFNRMFKTVFSNHTLRYFNSLFDENREDLIEAFQNILTDDGVNKLSDVIARDIYQKLNS